MKTNGKREKGGMREKRDRMRHLDRQTRAHHMQLFFRALLNRRRDIQKAVSITSCVNPNPLDYTERRMSLEFLLNQFQLISPRLETTLADSKSHKTIRMFE